MTTDTIQSIALSDISPDPGNNRADLGDVEGLAASIKSTGLQQLIKLRPASDDDGVETPWVITYGHRRFAALQHLGIDSHDFVVGGNGVQSKLAQVVENVQREDLTPFEEGDAYADLAAQYGMKQAQIAEAVGKDAGTVSKRLTIAKLSTEARAALERCAVEGGEEILDIARTCAKVPDEVWATVKKAAHLRDLRHAQKQEENLKRVKREVAKLYKAAKNGRPVVIVGNLREFEIPEKKGKIGTTERQTVKGVPWSLQVADVAKLPVDKQTQVVVFDGWYVSCYSVSYESEADRDARLAGHADERQKAHAENVATNKALKDALDQVAGHAYNQPKAEQVASIIAYALGEFTSGRWSLSGMRIVDVANAAGVELVQVPVIDDESIEYDEDGTPLNEGEQLHDENGNPVFDVDEEATFAAVLASDKLIPTLAGAIARSSTKTDNLVQRTKGETTKAFKALDPERYADCPLYQGWAEGRIEFTTHSL